MFFSSGLLSILSLVILIVSQLPLPVHGSPPANKVLDNFSNLSSIQAAGKGYPYVILKDGKDLLQASPSASGQVEPQYSAGIATVPEALSLSAADFTGDGLPDLVVGYQNYVLLYQANQDALYPYSDEALLHKAQGTFTDTPFLTPPLRYDLQERPDFMVSGDFDGDGLCDIVAAAKYSNLLQFLKGDGNGHLTLSAPLELDGAVTALAVGEIGRFDGMVDMVVGVTGDNISELLVFVFYDGAWHSTPKRLSLPAPADSVIIGKDDPAFTGMILVAVGSELLLIDPQNITTADEDKAEVENTETAAGIIFRRSFNASITSMSLGDFIDDQAQELAISTADGSLHFLHSQEVIQYSEDVSNPADLVQAALISPAIPLAGSVKLVSANLSSLPKDDLILIHKDKNELVVMHEKHLQAALASKVSVAAASPAENASFQEPVVLEVDSVPVAVLPMRLNQDALSDLVVLQSTSLYGPTVVETQPEKTFFVNDTGDSFDFNHLDGVCDSNPDTPELECTFRAALDQANHTPAMDQIEFRVDYIYGSPKTYNNPEATAPVTILGKRTVDDQVIRVVLDGTGGSWNPGLSVPGSDCVIRGFVIKNHPIAGIRIWGEQGRNTIEDNHILDNTAGIVVYNSENRIGGTAPAGNVISGNQENGIYFKGSDASQNTVQSNYIGTGLKGETKLGNKQYGVFIEGASGNTITQNVISGNTFDGIRIVSNDNGEATENKVEGNTIGLDAAGKEALGNGWNGVRILSSSGNRIGRDGSRNTISGNENYGILIDKGSGNTVQGNFIGLDGDGTAAKGNKSEGVYIDSSPSNKILDNVISGNHDSGIYIYGSKSTLNEVSNNWIGIDGANGNIAQGNGDDGISISGASENSIVGNTISANVDDGVYMGGTGAESNEVKNNTIGLDKDSKIALGNGDDGVYISNLPSNKIFDNIISSNKGNGIKITGSGATFNEIAGNIIGSDAGGTIPLGNEENGIYLYSGANNNFIGKSDLNLNLISANLGHGIKLLGSETEYNQIANNYIGGKDDLGNTGDGVYIDGAYQNFIGLEGIDTEPTNNVISGNKGNGISILYAEARLNAVQNNFIGTDSDGTTALGNGGDGIRILWAPDNSIGTEVGANLISANQGDGIRISGDTATGNEIINNVIGTSIDGDMALGNEGDGISLSNASKTKVGKGESENTYGNTLSGNKGNGISILGSKATENVVICNLIGSADGDTALPNEENGVYIADAPKNTIGSLDFGNTISGNKGHGILIEGDEANENHVVNNFIGTNSSNSTVLGNGLDGISLNAAPNNSIGSSDTLNIISGNGDNGISITGSGATGNTVVGNYIGLDGSGESSLGNKGDGVYISYAPQNEIGIAGTYVNLISGNDGNGISIRGSVAAGNTVVGNYIGLDVTGKKGLGNKKDGIYIYNAPQNEIGTAADVYVNLISGNEGNGLHISGYSAQENIIRGNIIGADGLNVVDLGNHNHGVFITNGAANNMIGEGEYLSSNYIGFNLGDGISIGAGSGNSVLFNSIVANRGLGIDLGNDGVTANDSLPGDPDVGANDLQNFPILSFADGITVASLNSTPNSRFRLEFFANDFCDTPQQCEGQRFLVSSEVVTDANGDASFEAKLTGRFITATATVVHDTSYGSTSEFFQGLQTSGAPYQDFGDTPHEFYPTLLADNGPYHVVTNLYLGAKVDAETDGQSDATATGDDTNDTDDEDGVVFTSPITVNTTAFVTVTASAEGLLSGWLDYNGDHDWDDAGEQIFIDAALAAGPNNLSFPVPADAVPGFSFARFRLSSQGKLAYTGPALDGEVEDYQVEVADIDSDGDGLGDSLENNRCTSATDADSDDDGIMDGVEDANHDGDVDAGETDPCRADTDGDGIQDGTESGITEPVADPDGDGPLLGTDMQVFIPDADPGTTTDPVQYDTDGDGVGDGDEDTNHNGRFDSGEMHPNYALGDINNDSVVDLADAISSLQAMSKHIPASLIYRFADVNGDGQIGSAEAGFALEIIAGQRVKMSLQSSSFLIGQPIPQKYGFSDCGGSNLSPPLTWEEIPTGTKSFVLIMDDPDAYADARTWVHWIVYDIPAAVTALAENAGADGGTNLPTGALHGISTWAEVPGMDGEQYDGPCPGGTHRYYFRLYALDIEQLDPASRTIDGIKAAMNGHVLGQAQYMGTFTAN